MPEASDRGGLQSGIRMLILDLDGTTLSTSGAFEERTAEAIQRATETGIYVAFASARPLWSIRELTAAVSPAYYIAAGGAVLASPDGTTLARWELAGDELRGVTQLLDEMDVPALLYRDEVTMRYGDSPEIRAEALLTAKNQHLPLWDGYPVDKLLAITEDPSALLSGLDRLPISATTSHASYVEVTAAGVDKAQATEVILRRVRVEWHDVMAIGDGDNDVCLLRKAKHAVTLVGGSCAAQEAADFVVGTNDDESVARLIEELGGRGLGREHP